jgi:hypothetical protein
MEQGDFVPFQPIASLVDGSPIEFHVPPSGDEYLDLGRTELYLQVKVTKADGTAFGNAPTAALTNLFLHSLFSQVDVKLRDTLVTPSVNTYAYKSYLETLLGFSEDSKKTTKTKEGWYWDVSSDIDAFDTGVATDNTGFRTRRAALADSKVLEAIGRPHVDVLQQDRFLLPGVGLSMRFIRSNHFFTFNGNADCKISIKKAVLYIRKVKINPAIALDHNETLNREKKAKYCMRRGVVTTFTIPQGSLNFSRENVISGQLPRRIIFGLVENAAYNGSREKNPLNFQHFGLNFLTLSTGTQNFPAQPLRPNYAQNEYLLAYNSLITSLGYNNSDKCIGISKDNYLHGNVLYGFDLTADMAEGAHLDPIKNGSLRMEGAFAAALNDPVNVIVYAEYDNRLQIDRARNIFMDF